MQVTINNLGIGRDVDETLRLVQAHQFLVEHGEVGGLPARASQAAQCNEFASSICLSSFRAFVRSVYKVESTPVTSILISFFDLPFPHDRSVDLECVFCSNSVEFDRVWGSSCLFRFTVPWHSSRPLGLPCRLEAGGQVHEARFGCVDGVLLFWRNRERDGSACGENCVPHGATYSRTTYRTATSSRLLNSYFSTTELF